jgi:cytoskeletal protein RodZ
MSRNRRSGGGVGAKLRKARERRGVSLRQIADATKISVNILQGLERNDIAQLPGGVFGRAFVRSFATAVGLNPEATVAEFVEQFPIGSLKEGYPSAECADLDEPPKTRPHEVTIKIHRWQPPIPLRVTVIVLLAAAVAGYFGKPKWWLQRAAVQSTSPAATQPGLANHADRIDGARGDVSRSVASSANPTDVRRSGAGSEQPGIPDRAALSKPPEAAFAPKARAGGGSNAADASSVPPVSLALQRSQARAGADAATDTTLGGNPGAGQPAADRLSVVLSATRPSWIIATVDGKKMVNRLLEVGEEEKLEAGSDLVLTMADAEAIVMTLNGQVARSFGRAGQTVTARINRINFREYLRRDRRSQSSR